MKLIGNAQLHCPGIGRNDDDWAVVSVSALYGATAAAYMLERPVSGCRPSFLGLAISTLIPIGIHLQHF